MALFDSELSQRVAPLHTVPLQHAQCAAASARYAGKTLAPWEEEYRHLIKLYIASPWSFGLFEDGCGYRKEKKKESFVRGLPREKKNVIHSRRIKKAGLCV